jgi:nucleotide-binding universal stress UspA family protein
MKEITCVVVPIDLNQHTGKLVDFAVYMAGKLSASLRFIHVVENPAGATMLGGSPTYEPEVERRMAKAKDLIDSIAEDNRAALADIGGTVVRGDVVDEIARYAEEVGAGMAIVGTHGARGLEKILLGSVAERVVKRLPCPTLTMNPCR